MEKCVAPVNPRTAAENRSVGEGVISVAHGEGRGGGGKQMMNRNLNEIN
jgi:hypothetical protein